MSISSILNNQTIIPEMLGTMPRYKAPEPAAEELPESGEYAKEFYHERLGREARAITRAVVLFLDFPYFQYVEDLEQALEDSIECIRAQEEKLARSGNAYLLEDADKGRRNYQESQMELAREKAEKEYYKQRYELTQILYNSLLERFGLLSEEIATSTTENKSLKAEKYNKKSVACADPEEPESKEQVKNGWQFASKDGKSMKHKQKEVFMGANLYGWSLEEIMKEYDLSEPVVNRYYREGKKLYKGHEYNRVKNCYTPIWETGCSEAELPSFNEFETDFTRDFNEFINEYGTGYKWPERLGAVAGHLASLKEAAKKGA